MSLSNNNEQSPLIVTSSNQPDSSNPILNSTTQPPTSEIEKRSAIMSFWTVGCIYGATSVMMGAFGAHGLKKRIADPQRLANWSTAAQYQLVHSGVLLLTTAVAPKNRLAASLFVAGMTMFSGSIYLLVVDPARFKFLGPVTPLGGLCLIAGWGALAFGSRGRILGA